MKGWYAIEYGRMVINNGKRANRIYRFDTKGERDAFVYNAPKGKDRDALAATNNLVKRALRYAEAGVAWPVPVADT